MSGVVLLDTQRIESTGPGGAAGSYQDQATSGIAHTKGAYTELIASTAFDARGVRMIIGVDGNNDCLMDLAVGAAGSEQIIVPNIPASATADFMPAVVDIPIRIPAGSRLAFRHQATGASQIAYAVVLLLSGGALGVPSGARASSFGATTADSGGVSVDPGAVANTKGSYSQITASTTHDVFAIVVCVGNQVNTARSTANFAVDVAIGAAASEQIIVPNFWIFTFTVSDHVRPPYLPLAMRIPTGTRIAMRAACSITDATDRLFDGLVLGVG